MDNERLDSLKMETTRFLMKSNRQRAIAAFPCRVYNMATDMEKLLKIQESGNNSSHLQSAIDYLESRINNEYRNSFGFEMGYGISPICCEYVFQDEIDGVEFVENWYKKYGYKKYGQWGSTCQWFSMADGHSEGKLFVYWFKGQVMGIASVLRNEFNNCVVNTSLSDISPDRSLKEFDSQEPDSTAVCGWWERGDTF